MSGVSHSDQSKKPERWTICVRAGSIREGRVISGRIHGNMDAHPTNVEVVEATAYDALVSAALDVVRSLGGPDSMQALCDLVMPGTDVRALMTGAFL